MCGMVWNRRATTYTMIYWPIMQLVCAWNTVDGIEFLMVTVHLAHLIVN